ncbi:SH3 domain containing protein [Acanthamoeba castellanii str. Neff]|uniref:SH3 domain containing protein n=1 Tax=Acanthamoeba castellanii (strain ATCC 30010 / Neff) TaxID=1257118 RepID=L8H8B1_ACACF|nr:SH3 domain containing protein [Acanthamoeba castellanii str. Neff]ELR21739.1 SH3 domain containing protein [Acanthamoeba castellanii str. Neff]
MGRGEEITITDQPDPLLQPDDEAASKKKNKLNKKKKAAKEKKERRKSRGDTDVVISHPDYDSFRDMADVIKDPQERASMLGARPVVDPAAQLPTGRVKRMFTIIGRKGERRKDSLPGSHRERWELIDPDALRKAPLPQSLVTHRHRLPPPLPPLPTHLQRHQSTPLQRRVAPPKPPPEADRPSATTSTTRTATLPAGAGDEIVLCVATYNFKAQQPSELSFNEGDIIEVLDQKKSDWWMGRLDGQCGLFPRIFVNLCTPPTPQVR